jgi:metal-responsive CopG/Arc/MetJ family transcriptional regulator
VESGKRLDGIRGVAMSSRKSKRMANITATLPIMVLDRIDELVEKDEVPSRSYVIREAVGRYLKEFEQK